VSARHQVKRLDRIFGQEFALPENRSGRRNKLSSFGADLNIRNFIGNARRCDLVLTCSPTPSFKKPAQTMPGTRISQTAQHELFRLSRHRAAGGRFFARTIGRYIPANGAPLRASPMTGAGAGRTFD
jgi:hypothetical protein